MRKVRSALPIVLAALAILGVLAVAGHAGRPSSPPGQSKPEPSSVELTGGLVGTGTPTAIRVTFVDSSLLLAGHGYEYPGDSTQSPTFTSNPDYPPSLTVTGPGRNMKQLRYYYCVHEDHVESDALICDAALLPEGGGTEHNDYYYCLQILGGTAQKKSDQVVFPVGSPWRISSKKEMGVVAQGTLNVAVTYDVIE